MTGSMEGTTTFEIRDEWHEMRIPIFRQKQRLRYSGASELRESL
jgi:hypothetical protein